MPSTQIVMLAKTTSSNNDIIEQQLAGLDYNFITRACVSAEQAAAAVTGADLIVDQGVPMPAPVIEAIDRARAIISYGHGYDLIDVEAATRQKIMVVNTAGTVTEEASNHAIMLLLACAKKLYLLDSLVRKGRWNAHSRRIMLPMVPIYGQTLGLVGLGHIGRAIARKARAFSLQILAYDPYLPRWIAQEVGVELVPDLLTLARRSDFVSVQAPLNAETYKMIGAAFFAAMKRRAYFINIGRGDTVDGDALVAALQDEGIGGAGLDVYNEEPLASESPLIRMDNVILTPHSAGTSTAAREAIPARVGEELARLMRGDLPLALINQAGLAQHTTRTSSPPL
jgi:D-3-phosphoglycerate dehydrogenase